MIIIFTNFRSVKDTWVNYLVDEEFAGPDDYIEKMMKSGEWADNIAIQLTADLLRRRIIIITTGRAPFSIHCETFFAVSKFPRRNFFTKTYSGLWKFEMMCAFRSKKVIAVPYFQCITIFSRHKNVAKRVFGCIM